MDLLIKCRADYNQADKDSAILLHAASFAGHVDVLDLLIKCDADCNQVDIGGRTSLHAALFAGHVDVVE